MQIGKSNFLSVDHSLDNSATFIIIATVTNMCAIKWLILVTSVVALIYDCGCRIWVLWKSLQEFSDLQMVPDPSLFYETNWMCIVTSSKRQKITLSSYWSILQLHSSWPLPSFSNCEQRLFWRKLHVRINKEIFPSANGGILCEESGFFWINSRKNCGKTYVVLLSFRRNTKNNDYCLTKCHEHHFVNDISSRNLFHSIPWWISYFGLATAVHDQCFQLQYNAKTKIYARSSSLFTEFEFHWVSICRVRTRIKNEFC